MATLSYFLIVILSVGFSRAQYEECGTKRSVLLKALFETGDNLYQMGGVFFQPRAETSRYIKVTYTFINTTTGIEGCNVTYIWANGGFLLVQPPTIFQFTSLFVSSPANKLKNLNLKLPIECQVLVSDNDGNCSCKTTRRGEINEDNDNYNTTILDRLTQQVNFRVNSQCN